MQMDLLTLAGSISISDISLSVSWVCICTAFGDASKARTYKNSRFLCLIIACLSFGAQKKFIIMKLTKFYFFLILSISAVLGLSSCEKSDGDESKFCNVQKAINAVSDKMSAKTLTINGELTKEDIAILYDIQSQLPQIENIILSSATIIPEGAFAGRTNTWLKTIEAPKVTIIKQSAFAGCLNLTSASFSKLETIDYSAFMSCESITSFDFSNVTSIEKEAFRACERLKTVSLPKITELKNAVFAECRSLESVTLPIANIIDVSALRACYDLVKLELGCTSEINFKPVDANFDTKKIDLVLEGVEASNAVGKIWKDVSWKSITSKNSNIKSPVFGVAYFGCTKTYVENNEEKTLYGGSGNRLVYRQGNTLWYYNFTSEGFFEWGMTEYSYQYDNNPALVTLPIREYQVEITQLINRFGQPTEKSEDIFAYDPEDQTDSEGHAYWFAKRIMNYGYKVEYKWITTEASVTSTLGYYPDKTKAWGFTIKSTYYPAD